MSHSDKKFANRLSAESSPYLLQHAHNPVDWFPWCEEALQKARTENRIILVSIGYAACHWCHIMEHESFESESVAQVMNENFINIKIDREERPDLDAIYMEAVQIMSGSGGWPLNVFLTPELKPFYGGTYFPPAPAYNRPSWMQVLSGISNSWKENSVEILKQSEELTEMMKGRNKLTEKFRQKNSSEKISELAFKNLKEQFDETEGGFGSAPKFPSTFSLNFLMHYYFFKRDEIALKQLRLSLDKMMRGGIYDQLGGGFARYSTDAKWLAPHFEKMLYDNALLIHTYADAYKLTRDKNYLQVVEETIEFVNRELKNPEGGFYSSINADSEGEEGKFYCWDKSEIENCLTEDSEIFCEYFNVSEEGNWEGKNILHTTESLNDFSIRKNLPPDFAERIISDSRKKLFTERDKRIRPSLDDKIILSWNALMISALANAAKATGEPKYKAEAVIGLNFLFEKFKKQSGEKFYYRIYKNGIAKGEALLEDYGYLMKASIDVYEITFEVNWLLKANELLDLVLENFSDTTNPLFFFTSVNQSDILIRQKDIFDNATPSSNSVLAENILKLGTYFDNSEWRDSAMNMYSEIQNMASQFPTSLSNWLIGIVANEFGYNEIVIAGKNSTTNASIINKKFLPNGIFCCSDFSNPRLPVLNEKKFSDSPEFYLCRNQTCDAPIADINIFLKNLNVLAD